MLRSSLNIHGASVRQTHGLNSPSALFDPPSAILKTSGNAFTLLWLVILKVSSLPIPQPCIISFRQPQRLCANSQQTSTSQIFLTATHHFSWLFTCRLPFFHRQNIQTPSFSPQQSCYIISAFTLSCHSPGFLSFHSCFVIRNPQDPVRLSKQAIWFSSHLASQRMFIISCFNNH